jgi:hypothetical protein
MAKMVRLLALILGGILAFVWTIFLLIRPDPVQWVAFEGDGFRCRVPGGPHSLTEENGWHKNRFTGAGRLYVSTRAREGEAEEQIRQYQGYVKPAYEAEIAVFENGRFFLEKRGKARRYIYLFTAGEAFFWVETSARGSTLRTYKDILDEVVASLEVDARTVGPEFRRRADKINGAIRWYSQGEELLLAMMFGIPSAIILFIALPLLAFLGKLPKFKGPRPLKSAQDLFAWVRSPGRINGTLVALALFPDRLEVYIWKRPYMIISKADGTIAMVPGKDRLRLRQGSRQAIIDLEYPLRWLSEFSARGLRVVRS